MNILFRITSEQRTVMAELPVVPRVGEWVAFNEDDASYMVRDVSYICGEKPQIIVGLS